MSKADFQKAITKARQVTITVTGRKTGKAIELPVWFAHDPSKLYLIPVTGSKTNWYRNLRKNPRIEIQADSAKLTSKARLVEDRARTKQIADMFRAKHGANDIKKYYSIFDVSVEIPLTSTVPRLPAV